jgi:hypothetical protein
MNHATWPALILLLAMSIVIVVTVVSAQQGKQYFIRRIPGLSAIDEAVGRAVEMGRGILLSTGLSDGIDIITLQALAICANVASSAARYGTRVQMPVYNSAMLPLENAQWIELDTVHILDHFLIATQWIRATLEI